SLRALFTHRVRATLALMSVSVGVAAVVLTSAIGAGAQQQIMRQIARVGSNLLVVRPAQVKRLVARKQISGFVTALAMEDYEAIAELTLVASAAPGLDGGMRVKAGSIATTTTVLGTTPAFPAVRRFRVHAGRFFDDEDDRQAERVVVLGAKVREALFGG